MECWHRALTSPRPIFPDYIGEIEVQGGEGTYPKALKDDASTTISISQVPGPGDMLATTGLHDATLLVLQPPCLPFLHQLPWLSRH